MSMLFLISPTLTLTHTASYPQDIALVPSAVTVTQLTMSSCSMAEHDNMNVRKSSVSCHNATPPETQNYAVQFI